MVAAKTAKRSAPLSDDKNTMNSDTSLSSLDDLVSGSAKKTRVLFSTAYSQAAMDEQER